MNAPAFEQPVPIFVGAGFPHQVTNVFDAYRILCEWHGRRGPAHTAALKACKAAMAGEIEPDTARGIFAAFARAQDILIPDGMPAGAMAHISTLHA